MISSDELISSPAHAGTGGGVAAAPAAAPATLTLLKPILFHGVYFLPHLSCRILITNCLVRDLIILLLS